MCIFPTAAIGWVLTLWANVPWTAPSVDVTFAPIFAEMGDSLSKHFFHARLPDEQVSVETTTGFAQLHVTTCDCM